MSDKRDYSWFAAVCSELAKNAKSEPERQSYLEHARAWSTLADKAERVHAIRPHIGKGHRRSSVAVGGMWCKPTALGHRRTGRKEKAPPESGRGQGIL